MSKTWNSVNAEACARQRPVSTADACGLCSDIWATSQMWEYSSRQMWVVLHVWMQLGQKTNRVYLSNPSMTTSTHICTQEQIHTEMLTKQTPGEETCLTQCCMCLFPFRFEMTAFHLECLERLKPCLKDNLGATIWSRFSFSHGGGGWTTFWSLAMQQKCPRNMIYLFKMDGTTF